jgi:hypothetical protein
VGMARCLGSLPELLVWDREECLHARHGRPTESYAAFCGQLPVGWLFREPADPQAKGCLERLLPAAAHAIHRGALERAHTAVALGPSNVRTKRRRHGTAA